MMTAIEQIESLRRQIVEALSEDRDTSVLERQLAEARIAEATRSELKELQPLAEQVRQWRERATELAATAESQAAAIATFLEARDAVTKPLLAMLPKVAALIPLQQAAQEHRGFIHPELAAHLPPGFTIETLSAGAFEDAHDKAVEALYHVRAGTGILSSLRRERRQILGGTDTGDPNSAPGGTETATEAGGPACSVCRHAQVKDIDRLLKGKTSLRTIASEYGVSRSALSRHRAHMRES